MRSAVALILVASLVPGCFPHSARNRTISEIVEGGLAVSGVVVESFVQSGADCDMTHAPGSPTPTCKQNASLGGGIGVALILAGVIGFIATISTAEDDDKPKPIEIKAAPETMPAPTASPSATPSATPPAGSSTPTPTPATQAPASTN